MSIKKFIGTFVLGVEFVFFLVFSFCTLKVDAAQFVGLRNTGNSCYMNALSQQLYHLDNFREEILAVKDVDCSKQPVIYSLQGIFRTMKNCKQEGASVDVSSFMRKFGSSIYRGSPGNAEYAFFQIINKCDSEFVGEKDHFSKLFLVDNNCEYTCHECQLTRNNASKQVGFTYDGKDCGELNNVLTTCTSQEKLQCGDCKKTNSLIKKETFKAIGSLFMLWTFCEHPIEYHDTYKFGADEEYKISGIIMGNSHHAYSYVRDKASNSWYRLNDGSVCKVGNFESIKNECFSRRKGTYATSVFYEKI